MADKPDVNESIKSRLIMTAVFIATLIFLVVAMVFSWFANNKTATANNMSTKLTSPELVDVELLDESMNHVDGLFELNNIIPGGEKVFYIKIVNNNDSNKTVEVLLSDINDGTEDKSYPVLLDKITLTSSVGELPLNTIYDFSDDSVKVVPELTIATHGETEIKCTFSMDEEAGNDYQNLTAVFEKVVVK